MGINILSKEALKNGHANLEPTHVEEELEKGEDREVQVGLVVGKLLGRVQELGPHQVGQQERVYGQRHHLRKPESPPNQYGWR